MHKLDKLAFLNKMAIFFQKKIPVNVSKEDEPMLKFRWYILVQMLYNFFAAVIDKFSK